MGQIVKMEEKKTASLKKDIIQAHADFMNSMEDAMQKGIKAGELLLAAKEQVEYGKFQSWIEENLPFSLRTAQNYMKIAKKQDVIEQKGAKMLSTAYDAVKERPAQKDYKRVHAAHEQVIDDEDSIPGEAEDQEEYDFNLKHPPDFEKPEPDLSYVAIILKASSSLRWAYRQLAAKRNSTTPKALGFFIGNLIEMAERIETWKPENMEPCEECEGTGVRASYTYTGEIEHAVCPNCINGQVGKNKRTDR